MKTARFAGAFLLGILLFPGAPANAETNGHIQTLIGPNRARLGPYGNVVVGFNLNGSEPSLPAFMTAGECRYSLWIDDGKQKQHWDFLESKKPMFPKRPSAIFTHAGRWGVSVVAASNTGCDGGARTDIDIDPYEVPKSSPAPATLCPPGWTLSKGKWDAAGFVCSPPKVDPLPCPPGTKWFEEAGTVGCRP